MARVSLDVAADFLPAAILFDHLIVVFLPSGFCMEKSKFLEEPRTRAGSVAENVFTAVTPGDKTSMMNPGTKASAAMKAINEVNDNCYGRFYVLEDRCTDPHLNLPESILRVSQSRHTGTICTGSCAVNA